MRTQTLSFSLLFCWMSEKIKCSFWIANYLIFLFNSNKIVIKRSNFEGLILGLMRWWIGGEHNIRLEFIFTLVFGAMKLSINWSITVKRRMFFASWSLKEVFVAWPIFQLRYSFSLFGVCNRKPCSKFMSSNVRFSSHKNFGTLGFIFISWKITRVVSYGTKT